MICRFLGVMMKIELEMEIRQISLYCDVILMILKEHQSLSVSKVCVFSFLIWQENLMESVLLTNRKKKDIVSTYLSQLLGKFEEFKKSYEYILKALNVLIKSLMIEYKNENVCLLQKKDNFFCKENEFTKKVIEQSKLWSDERFMREVLYNV